jgi:SPP1 family phage portal protein
LALFDFQDMTNETTTNEKQGIESYLVGRLPIYTSVERLDPSRKGELIAEINEALSIHVQNLIAMEDLYWYRRGITPIYGKKKTVRDEINNKINVNLADAIVNFKDGYFMTQPAFYVSRKEGEEITNKVDKLNEYLYRSGKQTADNVMTDWFHTVGKANLFVQSNDDKEVPFKAFALDPRSAFVVRSLEPGNPPVYAVHTVVRGDKLLLDVWDKENVYRLNGTVRGELVTPFPTYVATAVDVIDVKPNPLKAIPIIEYYYNSVQMGAFEAALPLLNAISALQSDRLDGVDQFIQSLLVFYNCELGEDENGNAITPQLIRAMGAVFLKSVGDNKADLKEISSQLDQSQTQVFIDNLYDQVLTICGMPMVDRQGARNHATGMVALVDNGWYQADTVARNTEDLFRESNKQFDEIVTNILREKGILDINPVDFTLQFVRNETANIQSKAQAFQTLLSAGMHPELAASKSGVSNDPVADMKMSEKYLKMIWGDPDVVVPAMSESIGEQYGLQANTNRGAQAQANLDEEDWLVNKNENRDGVTDSYYRIRNGRKELVTAYKKKASQKQDAEETQ